MSHCRAVMLLNLDKKEYVLLPVEQDYPSSFVTRFCILWLLSRDGVGQCIGAKPFLPEEKIFDTLGRWSGNRITVQCSLTAPSGYRDLTEEVLEEIHTYLLINGVEGVNSEILEALRRYREVLDTMDASALYQKYLSDLSRICDSVENGVCYIAAECLDLSTGDETLCTKSIPIAPQKLFEKIYAEVGGGGYRQILEKLRELGFATP